jgi:hypothetical protein
MQFMVSDRAALVFSQEFYRATADGYPVDAAVTEARRLVYLEGNPVEWGTPALFMRSPDGTIFEIKREANAVEEPEKQTQPAGQAGLAPLPAAQAGDVIIATIGAGARNVAVGKNITQQSTEDALADRRLIEQRLAGIEGALQRLKSKLNPPLTAMAAFQLKLLRGELTKTGAGESPSASTIVEVGDWLLENIPEIRPLLADLFSTPAGQTVLARTGERGMNWAGERFGGDG